MVIAHKRGIEVTRYNVVEVYYNLLRREAHKYRRTALARGYELDDVINVAAIGLLKSFDRFDESRGVGFMSFAIPTIQGEIKRWFRDFASTTVKYNRPIKDAVYRIIKEDLAEESIESIVGKTGLLEYNVVGALNLMRYGNGVSMDAARGYDSSDDEQLSLHNSIGYSHDETEAYVEEFMQSLDKIDASYRMILEWTLNGMTQQEIGKRLGKSQVQISRISRKLGQRYLAFGQGQAHTVPIPKPKKPTVLTLPEQVEIPEKYTAPKEEIK